MLPQLTVVSSVFFVVMVLASAPELNLIMNGGLA